MNKKKNYKLFIGIVIGVIVSATIVYAASYDAAADDIDYDNSTSGLSSSNLQGALDELHGELNEIINNPCPEDHYCEPYKNTLALGDYVEYTPVVESFDVDTSMTGYTGTQQPIYPSELNLWRVLNIYEDGRVDLISEYVSSTNVYFKGQKGYLNFVGYLNEFAKQYETEGITDETDGSRYFGYNGQTEYIEDTDPTSLFVNPAPWECSTGDTCAEPPVENEGGGDTLYTTDYNQLQTVLGSRVAYKVGTTTATSYWMASRYYSYISSTYYDWRGRAVNISGAASNNTSMFYYYSSGSFLENYSNNALRPIVTLKSGLEYEGLGTEWSPMKIITS